MGYGVVLDDGTAGGTQQFRSKIDGSTLNGTFTLWVRRPLAYTDGTSLDSDGNRLRDYGGNDEVLILVSEGSAPYTSDAYGVTDEATGQRVEQSAGARAVVARNRAVYTIETLLQRSGATEATRAECNSRQGQAGGSASGGNSSGCIALTNPSQVTEALVGGSNAGTGVVK
jgi:hypothetical protein